ncbi:GTP-binding protein [Clostridium magnum]|uniref:Urease accessory protein UreG n=2 Tax=Clostridium magnum TaxID=33954 RepID=A0A161YLG0_9CLOT|nr:GTP-binding protein [Clostridium magnum]KZL91422.1 urease accessory protein UreG [Clostridium magnum DSM 2767]
MKLITVSGPPSSGKTSVILKMIENLKATGLNIGVLKFDCLYTYDDVLYEKIKIPVKMGLSGNLCPDHFFVTNIEECVNWGIETGLDILISESAGLCNRCSPHIKGVLALCVIDNLSGVDTPKKIGPMLKFADIVVVTKGDIVSQAEREVFSFKIRQANPKVKIIFVNGITGQGIFSLCRNLNSGLSIKEITNSRLRFTMPSAVCSYCLGETRIGNNYQSGYVKK